MSKGMALLDCGCWKDYGRTVPKIGEEVICRKHGSARRVNESHYAVRCQKCPYSKPNIGNAPLTADVMATKHSVTRRHPVKITKYTNNLVISSRVIGDDHQPQLDALA